MKNQIAIIVSLSSAFLLFGCCSQKPKADVPTKNVRVTPNIGGACAGFGDIKCAAGLECYLNEEAQKMDDAEGICRVKLAQIGEACGTFSNIKCESSSFCQIEPPVGFDKKGTCVEHP